MDIGAHVSISGGMHLAIPRGEAIGATAIQTFASSPRTLKLFPVDEEIIGQYLKARSQSSILTHVFHGIYLVNLANEKPDYVKISMQSLINYQDLAGKLGVLGTIFHVGSHKGNGFDQVKKSVAMAISEIVKSSPDNTILMLENAAGHKGTIGQTLEELIYLIETAIALGADEKKIGLCLDTQHAFVSGVDARDGEKLDAYLAMIQSELGLNFVKVIHVNDSKYECNTHRDRHENVGSGFLGKQGLANWLNHPKLRNLPFILEVPGRETKGPGAVDINELKALRAT
jgi:deoxyribonuclease-4